MDINKNTVTAIIGPSGCGKSTLLRSINRMNDFISTFSIDGKILFNNTNIYSKKINATELRKSIGMVFKNLIHFLNQFIKIFHGDHKLMVLMLIWINWLKIV